MSTELLVWTQFYFESVADSPSCPLEAEPQRRRWQLLEVPHHGCEEEARQSPPLSDAKNMEALLKPPTLLFSGYDPKQSKQLD